MAESPSVTRFRVLAVLLPLILLSVLSALSRAVVGRSRSVRLRVEIDHRFERVPLAMGRIVRQSKTGTRLSVTRLSYLLSDITLLRTNGTAPLTLGDRYVFVDAAPSAKRTAFTLEGIPAGDYSGIQFQIGPDPRVNHADPAHWPSGQALNPLTTGLHWGWQGGYVFLALEGRYLRPDCKLGGYVFHLANDPNRTRVTLHRSVSLVRDSTLRLTFDVARLFDAVYPLPLTGVHGDDSTHSAPGDRLAPHLSANLARSFAVGSFAATREKRPAVAPSMASASASATPYLLAVPAQFPQPDLPEDNPLTVEGIALGKKLFFDRRLSGNNTLACAGCHRPQTAFGDGGHARSRGINGQVGIRRAIPLFNLAWSRGMYTWDGRHSRLRDQALDPIQDTREMRQSLPALLTKLKRDGEYPRLFARAFGRDCIDASHLGLAIEQYLLTLISADSHFDRALKGTETFTDEEKRGLQLFITEYDPARGKRGGDCFHCHGGNLFTDYRLHNNGLEAAPASAPDTGRMRITHRSEDAGLFKTPSLRNVALTGPYMHDGRFKTLEQVIDHYSDPMRRSDTLDPNIAKHPDSGLNLSKDDKRALVAFLRTLTDERFSHP